MPRHGRFSTFLRRQFTDIRRGGPSRLWQKVWSVLLALPFLPLVLLARAIYPVVVLRVGYLNSYRIGHFAINTELYLSNRDVAKNRRPTFDVFFLEGNVCNQQLKNMWSRNLRVSSLARHAYACCKMLPGSKNHMIPMRGAYDMEGVLEETKPHLSFSPEEEERGRQELKLLGLPDGTPFICIHARDSGYLEYSLPSDDPDRWRYHDHRDTSIHSYIPAAEQMAGKGYFAFRTGVAVKEAINSANPRIIDYAMAGRTDFLDIYLSAKCHFFVVDTAGMSQVPLIFRKPIAWVNYVPLSLAPTWQSKDLFLPKKLWSIDGHRFLTFHEILDSDICRFYTDEQYVQQGIEIVDNTSEEITSLVLEMERRLAGTWETTDEDEELQAGFWELFLPKYPKRVFRSRIGAEFLRQNRELLVR